MVRILEVDYSQDLSACEMRKALSRDGLFVVRQVLTPSEIDTLREIVRKHLRFRGQRFGLGLTQPNAAVVVPELCYLFSMSKIVDLFRNVIPGRLVFTGHCDIHMNMLSGWHKDSGETVKGGYFQAADYMTSPDCQVFKIAVYLQDSDPQSAFAVRLGSHRSNKLDVGEVFKAETKSGDVVIFDVRISHAGQLPDTVEKMIKAANLLANRHSRYRQDSRIASFIKYLYWKLVGKSDRLSAFFTYGADNSYTRDFAEANMRRQQKQAGIDTFVSFPPGLEEELQKKDVKLSFPSAKSAN